MGQWPSKRSSICAIKCSFNSLLTPVAKCRSPLCLRTQAHTKSLRVRVCLQPFQMCLETTVQIRGLWIKELTVTCISKITAWCSTVVPSIRAKKLVLWPMLTSLKLFKRKGPQWSTIRLLQSSDKSPINLSIIHKVLRYCNIKNSILLCRIMEVDKQAILWWEQWWFKVKRDQDKARRYEKMSLPWEVCPIHPTQEWFKITRANLEARTDKEWVNNADSTTQLLITTNNRSKPIS